MKKLSAIIVFLTTQVLLANFVCAAKLTVVLDDTKKIHLIYLSGPIVRGDSGKFAAVMENLEDGIIYLSSEGGLAFEGIEIGRMIREHKFATVVLHGETCASSCGLIWLGGVARIVESGARVGFHAIYILTKSGAQEVGSENALAGAYLNGLGLTYDAIYYATAAAPSEMAWLTDKQARELRIEVLFGDSSGYLYLKQREKSAEKNVNLTFSEPIAPPAVRLVGDLFGKKRASVPKKLYYERIVGEKTLPSSVEIDILTREKLLADISFNPSNWQMVVSENKGALSIADLIFPEIVQEGKGDNNWSKNFLAPN